MELDITQQAVTLLLFFVLGIVLGVLYDLLTPLRRRGGRGLAGLTDAAFSLCAACLVFLLSMRFAPDGRAGTWELAAAFLGFVVYINTLGRFVYRIFQILSKLPDKLMKTTENF